MLAASQDIDSFIERQRSKINKPPSSRPTNNQLPPPHPPNNVNDRLDFQVAQIFNDRPPQRVQSQQPYYPQPQPPPPPSFNDHSHYEQQENYYPAPPRRLSDDKNDNNSGTFFNKFGTYDDKRSQLKDDLKREYNEYLQSKKPIGKSKSTSQLAAPQDNSTNRRVQFQQPSGKVVAPWEKNEKGQPIKNVQSMNDLPSTSMEYSTNRSRPPPPPSMSRNPDGQYSQDRESYISELHSQIRELESQKKQLEYGMFSFFDFIDQSSYSYRK